MDEIERLQSNLMLFRTTAGLSVQEFADMLDITRQTVNNLESGKTKMSKVQYLAIRSCFSYLINKDGNDMLEQLLICLVDNPESVTAEDRELISNQAKILNSAIKGGSSKEEISDSWKRTIELMTTGIAILTPVLLETSLIWIDAIMRRKRK